ncbi:hypothetical protein SUGI_0297830 [Cryptomeria japonica]|nr:hypothetical protein SUGI_0297830 [Cryptomeria japonica]
MKSLSAFPAQLFSSSKYISILRFCLSAGPAVCYVDGAVYFSPVIVGIALPSLQEIDGGALFVVAAMGWLGLGVKALVLCGRREFFLLHCICLDFPLPAVGSSRVDLWCGLAFFSLAFSGVVGTCLFPLFF